MQQNGWPTAEKLRRALIERCDAYGALAGLGRSEVSRLLTNNTAFLGRVANGLNITLESYDRAMHALDRLFLAKIGELEGLIAAHSPPKGAKDEPTAQRSGGKSRAVHTNDRGNRRRAGVRKGRLHGTVPDAAE